MKTTCVNADMLLIHTNRKTEGLVRVISLGNSLRGPSWHALPLHIPPLQGIKSLHI